MIRRYLTNACNSKLLLIFKIKKKNDKPDKKLAVSFNRDSYETDKFMTLRKPSEFRFTSFGVGITSFIAFQNPE